MTHHDATRLITEPQQEKAFLCIRMIRVVKQPGALVEESSPGFLKRNAVLYEIGSRLCGIPGKLDIAHSNILEIRPDCGSTLTVFPRSTHGFNQADGFQFVPVRLHCFASPIKALPRIRRIDGLFLRSGCTADCVSMKSIAAIPVRRSNNRIDSPRNARTRLRAGAQYQTRRQVFAKDPAQRALVTFRAPFQLRDHTGVGKPRPGDGE